MAKIGELDDVSLLKLFIGLRDRRAQRKAAYNDDDSWRQRKAEQDRGGVPTKVSKPRHR